jgi:hypothetical protein
LDYLKKPPQTRKYNTPRALQLATINTNQSLKASYFIVNPSQTYIKQTPTSPNKTEQTGKKK